ncbi:MAG TPA: MFS transporter [Vicinamibacteria bacterium]|nr:MFS transporter [Vicinamibacteria bacterium]
MSRVEVPDEARRRPLAGYRGIGVEQRRNLLAASLGWMLDSMDVQLYAFILLDVMRSLGMDSATGGLLASLTLLSSAAGGVLFGIIADRAGRTRALMASILVYSVFTAACGFAQTVTQLALFRILLGLGMGGEWAAGAALVAETWPPEHRAKAMGIMQSAWAVGYALAAALAAFILPRFGWRAVFYAGVLPALITLWIRRRVREPEIWLRERENMRSGRRSIGIGEVFSKPYRRNAIVATLMNASTMFAWWGLFTWIPSYLKLASDQGGAGLSVFDSSLWILVLTSGQWLGYVSFGFIADALGRRKAYLTYLLLATALVPVYGATRDPTALLLLGPFLAFFGTGYFSGFGAITAELFPTRIRVTAQGLTYNAGRVASAGAPFAVGTLAMTHGLGMAFSVTAAAYFLAAVLAWFIPETRGQRLE